MDSLEGVTLRERYYLRKHVGAGGFADVYQAWDALRATHMAIKVMRRDLANNPRFFKQFSKEAEVLRKLEHPNIVRLYEFDREDDLIFIVMDWIEGGDIRQLLARRLKPLSLDEVSQILGGVSAALNYAHQNQIYHCDIKPANIMMHVDGRVLLSDFGVARLASEKVGGGTPIYMAPELFNEAQVGVKTDIYSLGITLYEMLSGGIPPYRGDNPTTQGSTTRERIAWEHCNLPMPPLRQHNSSLPNSIEEVVAAALEKDPTDRFETVLKMQEAFEQAKLQTKRQVNDSSTRLFPLRREEFTLKPVEKVKAPEVHPSQNVPVSEVSLGIKGPRLVGQKGEWAGHIITLSPRNLTLGRNKQCHIHFNEASVSRFHATIIRGKKGVYIRDENSSLGTFVNGFRILGPTLLKPGDIVQVGQEQVFLYLI